MSNLSVEFIPGPPVNEYSREAAEAALRRHSKVASGAPYAIEEVKGTWVAAIIHEAEFPPAGGDEEESSPAPKSEPGGDEGASAGPPEPDGDESGPPSGDEGGSEGDSEGGEKKKDGKGGKEEEILALLQAVVQALGIPVDAGDGLGGGDELGGMPGEDPLGAGGPPDAGGPPGAGGPPPGAGGPPPGGHGGSEQHIIHERSLKPGEVPPGGTPVGAPAFSHVRPDHPWAEYANRMASFHVSTELGDAKVADVEPELHALASEIGYRVARLGEARNEFGQRVAAAVVTKH